MDQIDGAGQEEKAGPPRLGGMRSIIFLAVAAAAAAALVANVSAMTLPLRVKVTVSGQSCRFTQVVRQSQVQATLARRCPGSPIAGIALPTLLNKQLTVLRGRTWTIRLLQLP